MITAKNNDGYTPMHLAVFSDNSKIIKRLYNFYPSNELVNAKDNYNQIKSLLITVWLFSVVARRSFAACSNNITGLSTVIFCNCDSLFGSYEIYSNAFSAMDILSSTDFWSWSFLIYIFAFYPF